jgi:peroxiredoxin-like protein
MSTHLYQVDISWSNDRKGMMCSPELLASSNSGSCIEVATPPEFPKGIPGIWSPEHLFTAAVSSCFMTTFLAVAENSKLEFVSFRCLSKGKLEQIDGKYQMTEVLLEPTVVIKNRNDVDRALKVLQKAEANCLITNSIKSKVVMEPQVQVETISV